MPATRWSPVPLSTEIPLRNSNLQSDRLLVFCYPECVYSNYLLHCMHAGASCLGKGWDWQSESESEFPWKIGDFPPRENSLYVAEFHSLTRFLWAQTVQSLHLIASLRLETSHRRCLPRCSTSRLYYVIVQLKPNSAIFAVDYQPVMGRIDCS
jgi:hypothetical protein